MIPPRVTRGTRLVLYALLDSTPDRQPAHGHSIIRDTGLAPAVVYPILDRLEVHGWITSHPEPDPPQGRPARRHYQLTPAGHDHAEDLLLAEPIRPWARYTATVLCFAVTALVIWTLW